MPDVISIALVGIGGYGNSYVSALLDAPNQQDFRIAAAIDPAPHLCRRLNELETRGAAVYPSLEAFYAASRADLAIISTPLHLHASQTILALGRGSHVLCEKPLCVTPKQASDMLWVRDDAGKVVSIGYQWSFSRAVQQLKADLLAGLLGRPRRLKCLVLWPRDEVYYGRNRWAGAKRDASGNIVLDSPVNNACAHYLHNLFYLLGPRVDRSDQPLRVSAELYRAHAIENYDTAAVHCHTAGGAEILFVVSHATAGRRGPMFSIACEKAVVTFSDQEGPDIVARFADGSTRSYGSPNDQKHEKIWSAIASARDGTPTVCGIEAASAHVRCAWAAQRSMPEIRAFPASLTHVQGPVGSRRSWVEGLDDVLECAYEQFKLPSDLNVAWAACGNEIALGEEGDRELDEMTV